MPTAEPWTGAHRAVAGVVALAVAALHLCPLWGTDIWWHVENGRRWLNTGAIPADDVYSHLARGLPVRATPWLADIVFALVDAASGPAGLVVFGAVLAAAVFAFAVAHFARLGVPPRVAVVVAATLSLVLQPRLSQLRPSCFTSVLIVATTLAALALLERPGRGRAALLAVLCVAWIPLHGAHPLGTAIACATAVAAILLQGVRSAAWPVAVAAVAAVAVFAVPGGLDAWDVVGNLEGSLLAATVDEHRPVSFATAERLLLAIMALGVVGGGMALVRPAVGRREILPLLLSLLAVVWLVGGRRALYDSILLALPGVAVVVSRARAPRVTMTLAALAWGAHVWAAPGTGTFRARFGFGADADYFPTTTATRLAGIVRPESRLLNSFGLGGYLIYQGHLVLVDSRGATVYPDDLVRTVLDPLYTTPEGLERWSRALRLDVALSRRDALDNLRLASSARFAPVAFDRCCVLYVTVDRAKSEMIPVFQELRFAPHDGFMRTHYDGVAADPLRLDALARDLARCRDDDDADNDETALAVAVWLGANRPEVWQRIVSLQR